jgi:hypothetical protein
MKGRVEIAFNNMYTPRRRRAFQESNGQRYNTSAGRHSPENIAACKLKRPTHDGMRGSQHVEEKENCIPSEAPHSVPVLANVHAMRSEASVQRVEQQGVRRLHPPKCDDSGGEDSSGNEKRTSEEDDSENDDPTLGELFIVLSTVSWNTVVFVCYYSCRCTRGL